jgi:hypothetical protein
MLRENLNTYNPPAVNDLSVKPNMEILLILNFIDENISNFRPYYLSIKDSDRENRITDFLVHYFQVCLKDNKYEGFPPFDFRKNPTQEIDGKETDMGVFVLTKNIKPISIIEFEAKRLSATSNNKEYICGDRGGIERFKRCAHGAHLLIAGMFGYIQDTAFLNCADRINQWIDELSKDNTDMSIDWSGSDEKLISVQELENNSKWSSLHTRFGKPSIELFHYFLNLTNN